MLDFSFGEILVVAIIAIIFLGPDKLPQTLIDIAKFFKSVKKTINDAKDSIGKEIQINELKKEVLSYKEKFNESTSEIKNSIGNTYKILENEKTSLENNLRNIENLEDEKNEKKLEGPIKRKINKTKSSNRKNLKKQDSIESNKSSESSDIRI